MTQGAFSQNEKEQDSQPHCKRARRTLKKTKDTLGEALFLLEPTVLHIGTGPY
jgi:hypothetical protein